jgi:hypothetical protein
MSRERVLLGLAVVCLLVAVGAVGYGAGKASDVPEVIQAQRFEMLDEEGRVRAVVGLGDDDGAGLAVMDEKGHALLALGTKPDGSAGLVVLRETGMPIIAIGVGADRSEGLAVLDKEGKPIWAAPYG